MQNDKFKFQTVANTRQMVPAKKSKKNSQTCSKKKLKLFHTQILRFKKLSQRRIFLGSLPHGVTLCASTPIAGGTFAVEGIGRLRQGALP
jgi:hypothetical protein